MDTLTLINRAHQGDKLARDKILIENTGLIWSIVRRFLNRGHEGRRFVSNRMHWDAKSNRQI